MLEHIEKEPNRIWFAKDFQHGEGFVGYEAGSRMCDLVNAGHMEKVGNFDKDGNPGGKYAGYKLCQGPVVITKRQRPPTKEQLIKAAYIAGRSKTIMDPTLGMFLDPVEMAEDYYKTLSI